jgi:hypothetical protein
MTTKPAVKKRPGRKPANGIAAQTIAQRRQRRLEKQLTRIEELPHTEWVKSECLLILQRKALAHLEKYAVIRLAQLYGDSHD